MSEAAKLGSNRALAWYVEAMRIFKRHPLGFAGLSGIIIVTELAITAIPAVGPLAANIVVPLLACSLLFAALATDRNDRPRLKHLIAPFTAPAGAMGAVVVASLIVFAIQWMIARVVGDIDLMAGEGIVAPDPLVIIAIYGGGIAASLPMTLVPMLALFEGNNAREAFAGSLAAFLQNLPAFLLYGAISIALAGIGLLTFGIALLIVVPLWAASSYAAWKDLSGLGR